MLLSPLCDLVAKSLHFFSRDYFEPSLAELLWIQKYGLDDIKTLYMNPKRVHLNDTSQSTELAVSKQRKNAMQICRKFDGTVLTAVARVGAPLGCDPCVLKLRKNKRCIRSYERVCKAYG